MTIVSTPLLINQQETSHPHPAVMAGSGEKKALQKKSRREIKKREKPESLPPERPNFEQVGLQQTREEQHSQGHWTGPAAARLGSEMLVKTALHTRISSAHLCAQAGWRVRPQQREAVTADEHQNFRSRREKETQQDSGWSFTTSTFSSLSVLPLQGKIKALNGLLWR